MSQDRRIVEETVLASETEKYVRVQYDSVSEMQGGPLRERTPHYYSAYRGKWIDLHISYLGPVTDDENPFAAFDKRLSYGP